MINPPTANSVQFNVLSSLIQLKILFMGGKFFLQGAFRGFIPRFARNGSAATTIPPRFYIRANRAYVVFVSFRLGRLEPPVCMLRGSHTFLRVRLPPRLQSAQNRAYVFFARFRLRRLEPPFACYGGLTRFTCSTPSAVTIRANRAYVFFVSFRLGRF